MNFTAVRGFNAYAQFSAKVREAAKAKENGSEKPESLEDDSFSLYSEPIDVVTISKQARSAADTLTTIRERSSQKSSLALPESTAHTEFREWLRQTRPSGLMSGSFSQSVPGSVMNKALSGSGITVGDDEEYNVNVDVMSSVTVSSANAEKAKAIQDLLRSTPIGINWGLLLATLPPRI